MSANVDKCSITLFHMDKRVSESEWSDTSEVSFSKQTANKANDVICGYFAVTEEWDKNLLKCVFLDDVNFNLFEFGKSDNANLIVGVQVNGNRHIVFNSDPEARYKPIEDETKKLSVSVRSFFGNNNYDLTYEQISKERSNDFSIVALFNSTTFNHMHECSTNLFFARELNIIKL